MLYLLSLLLFLFTSNCGTFICFISGYGQKYGQKCRLPTAHFGQWGISFLSISIAEYCFIVKSCSSLIKQRLKLIPGLALTLFAVLNGFCRAATNARHAVGTVATPDRLAVLNRDIVCRAEPDTLTAADAGVAGCKGICFDEERIEDRIHRAAHKAVVEVIAGLRERLIRCNGGDHTVNVRLSLSNDLPRFLRLRHVEHGNVIFGHDDLRRAHTGELSLLAERTVIPSGIADLTAAGHDEPCLRPAGKIRFCQMIPNDARDAPRVSRGNDNQALIGCDWRSIARLDAVVHAEKFVVQSDRNALCNVPAVPGTGEIQNHINNPSQQSISCWMISSVQPVKALSLV